MASDKSVFDLRRKISFIQQEQYAHQMFYVHFRCILSALWVYRGMKFERASKKLLAIERSAKLSGK